ncbi:MAG: alpha/beta hydrolase [Burkholderiales bacterium]|nr:alpha/beta hydrolase [Burkholderiales bacterium]
MDNEVKCGTLEVFENRETRQGRKIALNIVVVPAVARNKEPDPVFFFAGGPGQAAAQLAREALAIVGGINNKRDLVLVDQRGTGKSNGLACAFPEPTSPEMANPAKRDEVSRKALTECRDKLAKKADLTQYTTTIAMADIEDVREALGYQTINLWGGSYGTRAAMEYMRRFDSRVRSVVLDGVAPPSLALLESFARDAGAVLEKMMLACGKEVKCSKQNADLKATLDDLLAVLAKVPRSASVADPVTGLKRDVMVTREMLLTAVFPALYVPEMAAMLPTALASAKQGDFAALMTIGGVLGDSTEVKLFRGMQLSVVCAEDVPRVRRDGLQPQPFGQLFVGEFEKACALWPKGGMSKDFDQPVKSAKPVLILSGALDPVTPPQYGEEVKKNFPNSLHAIAPNIGHGVSHRGCGPKLIKKFIETASLVDLDIKCLERMPRPTFFEPLREPVKAAEAKSPLLNVESTR